jgi:phosphoenolpyruvate-protein kinase (PTS system EI component)
MTNAAVVQRLGALLARKRHLLPAQAARRADAINAQLPMLESQLSDMAVLDPLAQDARRLLGRHLPDLIDRYERVPSEYRAERDADGLDVDQRLTQGLDAATSAIDELGRKLARDDVDAFQTQGRFLEDRYREDGPIRSE